MLEFAQDFDLRFDGFLEICVSFQNFYFNLFDSDFLFGLVLETLEYLAEGTLAQAFGSVVRVPTDHFQVSTLFHSVNIF